MNMNGETEKNLKNLFEKFLDPEQARQAAEDVRKGEQILREHTAPEPDGELINNIKAEITARLLRKKDNSFIYRAAAIAAGFIILAIISVKLFETGEVQPSKPVGLIMPKTVWESERLADDDAASATLVDEVKQIENDLLAMQVGENGSNSHEAATELEIETELTEISSNFWKG
jgi:hypothetical protein